MEVKDMIIGLATSDYSSWFSHLSDTIEVVIPGHEYDLIIFTGGEDVCPLMYSEEPGPGCNYWSEERDSVELDVAAAIFGSDIIDAKFKLQTKYVLGVCRGHQFLNVFFGGSLHQDMFSIDKSHRGIHGIEFIKPRKKDGIYSLKHVNSMHHQAIKVLAPKAEIMAIEPATRLIEMVDFHRTVPTFGVQFHPEAFSASESIWFFNELIKEMENKNED